MMVSAHGYRLPASGMILPGYRLGGTSAVFPDWEAALAFSDPAYYSLTGGVVNTAYNLGTGAGMNATQATAAQRPSIVSGRARFDNTDDNLKWPGVGPIIESKSLECELRNVPNALVTNLSIFDARESGSGAFQIVLRGTSNLFRVTWVQSGGGFVQRDIALGAAMSTGVEYKMRFTIKDGLFNAWINDVQKNTNEATDLSAWAMTIADVQLGISIAMTSPMRADLASFKLRRI